MFPVEEPSGGAENPGEETGIGQEGDSSQGEGGNGSTGQPPDEEGETGTDTPPIVTIDPDDVLPDRGAVPPVRRRRRNRRPPRISGLHRRGGSGFKQQYISRKGKED